MFWFLAAVLTLVTALAILRPFWGGRGAGGTQPGAAYDLRVYRDQLAEVDRDLARGIVSEEDAQRLRTEIGRKVLEADRALQQAGTRTSAGRSRQVVGAAVLLALTLGGGIWVYSRVGAPAMDDAPLARRLAAAQDLYQSRLSQEEAERAAPARPEMPPPDPEYVALIERLRAAVAERPDDPQGLMLLARHEARLGNSAEARAAQERLIALRGDAATADDHVMLAGLMTEAAGGIISPEAEMHVAQALARDPRNIQARYMAGLLQAQNGRPDRAFPVWAQLLTELPPDAPMYAAIRPVIEDLAWLAGESGYVPPDAAAVAGPPGMPVLPGAPDGIPTDPDELSPAEREQMLGDMVRRLEARLAQQGGTADEWARLIGSLVQIGDAEHAREILAEARQRFADSPEAMASIEAAARDAGLALQLPGAEAARPAPGPSAGPGAAPGPDQAAIEAAATMSDSERSQMIAGMVEQLETRLDDQGGSGAEWARLVSSLAVLDAGDRARAALQRGRAALADRPDELATLEAAASQAGL